MDIAIGGIILIIILLPGISFRKGYFSEEFSNQYTIKDFFELFVNTLFPSLLCYILILPIIYLICGYYYDFSILLGILSSNDNLVEKSAKQINEYKFEIIFFQLIVNSLAFLFGIIIKNEILEKSYDAKNKFFRYKNPWHYILTGKYILFKRSAIKLHNDSVKDIDITFIDSVVTIGNETYIYTGMLVDYELSEDGSLDLLYIKDVFRKLLNEEDYKEVNGHTLILKYENIINLNVTFIQTEQDNNGNVKLRLIE